MLYLKNSAVINGLLMFVYKAVKPARIFVNRLLQALRQCEGHSIRVTDDIVRDLQWFVTLLEEYNGVSKYIHPKLNDLEVIALDACLIGIGAVFPQHSPLSIWRCGTSW